MSAPFTSWRSTASQQGLDHEALHATRLGLRESLVLPQGLPRAPARGGDQRREKASPCRRRPTRQLRREDPTDLVRLEPAKGTEPALELRGERLHQDRRPADRRDALEQARP